MTQIDSDSKLRKLGDVHIHPPYSPNLAPRENLFMFMANDLVDEEFTSILAYHI